MAPLATKSQSANAAARMMARLRCFKWARDDFFGSGGVLVGLYLSVKNEKKKEKKEKEKKEKNKKKGGKKGIESKIR